MLNKSNEQKISGHTRLYAVIGNPVRHSLSPALQTAAFRETGIDAVMLAFEADTDNLEQVVESLKTLDSPGWNVTMPCKGRMAELCDELTREAQLTGSVNTVVNRDGKLIGHSTDGIGLMRHLQASGIDIRNRKIVIAGAGGAAASIAAAASGIASEVVIANRTTRKAEELASRLNIGLAQAAVAFARENKNAIALAKVRAIPLTNMDVLREELKDAALFINAGSAGMAPHENTTPLADLSILPENCAVADIVYNPRETCLLREAKKHGLTTCGGLGMLVQQGAEAFELWTGEKFPVHRVVETVLGEQLY